MRTETKPQVRPHVAFVYKNDELIEGFSRAYLAAGEGLKNALAYKFQKNECPKLVEMEFRGNLSGWEYRYEYRIHAKVDYLTDGEWEEVDNHVDVWSMVKLALVDGEIVVATETEGA